MTMVYACAMKSKDASTQVGAVIVGAANNMVSMGFNGLPRGLKETPERSQRPLKYLVTEHAERNSIYNAARVGAKLEDCIMYTQICPCAECARGIIQVGIKEIVVSKYWDQILDLQPQWAESLKVAREMIDEVGIKFRTFDGTIKSVIENVCSGQEIKF